MSSEPSVTDFNSAEPALESASSRDLRSPDKANLPHVPPSWQTCMFALVTVLAFMLGSGRETWSFGVICCLLGGTVLCCPPLFRLPRGPAIALLLLAVLPSCAFLPLNWLGASPHWRQMLWEAWGIELPSSLTPVPKATLEAWLGLLVGLVWFWACLAHGAADAGRRVAIYTLAVGGAVVVAASWVDAYLQPILWWPRYDVYTWDVFGPFANRNHTASLNAITSILCAASAYDAYRRKSRLVWFFGVIFWMPFTAILMNTSRGGLLILFLGLIAWVTTSAMKRGTLRKLAVGGALLIVIISVASVSGGKLGSRIRGLLQEDNSSVVESSMRVDLARQVVRQFTENPWVGKGLGTFSSVFPQVSTMNNPMFKFWHPESDVLLLLFEGGLLLVLPSSLLLVWIARSSGPWATSRSDKSRDRSGRRLRQAAAIGAGMALIHSVFDMPNHILAYGMQTMLLLGLAIRPQVLTVRSGWVSQSMARMLGLAVFCLGVLWLGIGLRQWAPDLKSAAFFLRGEAIEENKDGRYREALALVDRCIWLSPMDCRLYYFRGQLLLKLRQRPERALVEFGRSRALEPDYAALCYEEGIYWLKFAPEYAMIPWRECLQREARGGSTSTLNYQRMVSASVPYAELLAPLWNLAENTNKQMVFMEHIHPQYWNEYLPKFIEKHPKLDQLERQHLRLLMKLWHERGNREELIQMLESNADLQPFGWRTLAIEMARQGRYEEALIMAKKFLKRPGKPPIIAGANVPRLERAFLFNPTDVRPGIELYFAQRAAHDLKGARATAERVTLLPDAPAYMKVELALLDAELGDQRRAWEMMEQAMELIPDS